MTHTYDLTIVGAGLAGLSAAAAATAAGLDVTIVDRQSPGGRVRSDERGGFALNRGPHALYRGGPGWNALASLGITPRGAKPPLGGAAMLADGELHALPTGAGSLLRNSWLSPRDRAQLGVTLARVSTVSRAGLERLAQTSASEWIEHQHLGPRATAVARALCRLATYCHDLDLLSADAAVGQIQASARHGVLYLDGGWQQLVDALSALTVPVRRATATGVVAVGGGFEVSIVGRSADADAKGSGTDEVIRSRSVVVAVDSPTLAAALLTGVGAGTALASAAESAKATAVTAACLDLIVAPVDPGAPTFVLGIDDPMYLSMHHPVADLNVGGAPPGQRVLQLARYGATDAASDRALLDSLATAGRVRTADVVSSRFLADMTVISAPPTARAGGIPGRPKVTAAAAPGCFVAGDWVGPGALLADVALTSGVEAARQAAAHLARRPVTVGLAS